MTRPSEPGESAWALTIRQIRLRGVWLLIPPFFYFARPSPALLAGGGVLVAIGLTIRAWAAGVIHKDQLLSTTGPYAYTRNPLYLGSFFLGLGVAVAAGQWVYVGVFLALFIWVYGSTMLIEARSLEERFGDAYRAFAEAVPLFFPRFIPARLPDAQTTGFDGGRWKAHREWEALLGAVAVFGLLILKLVYFPS